MLHLAQQQIPKEIKFLSLRCFHFNVLCFFHFYIFLSQINVVLLLFCISAISQRYLIAIIRQFYHTSTAREDEQKNVYICCFDHTLRAQMVRIFFLCLLYSQLFFLINRLSTIKNRTTFQHTIKTPSTIDRFQFD